ncbi:MAG: response regulator [Lachnospiraceae bacterium]|nr:response regulator [Lachnospiraceae bacterium]
MIRRKSIIAVDDSKIVLQTLEGILGGRYEFRGFSKAERALDYITLFPPSLIILDIDMPEINGYELSEMIMEKKELRGIPIIFLTSNNDKHSVIKAAAYGADDYILKPIDRNLLMGRIETLLQ